MMRLTSAATEFWEPLSETLISIIIITKYSHPRLSYGGVYVFRDLRLNIWLYRMWETIQEMATVTSATEDHLFCALQKNALIIIIIIMER